MSWIPTSVMGRKAFANGQIGARHYLSDVDQGTFHYVYGPIPSRCC